MRFPKSIRWRLQLWYGALLVAVLCGFGFMAFHFEKARRFRRIDEELQARVSTLVVALRAANRPGPPDGQPPPTGRVRTPGAPPLGKLRLTPQQSALFGDGAGHYFAVWLREKEPLLHSPNAPANIPQPRSRDAAARTRGEFRESFIYAAPVDCVLVGRSVAAEAAELRTFAAVLAAIGGAVLAAGLLGGWWLATRAIRPVDDITSTAEKIAAGDLSQRIGTAETDSELGRLASVLNATFARLEAAFAQQGRFTADAAHELRTPVSVILTQTQSALARERPADEYRETVEACQRAAHRMRGLIESLLELARLDAGQEPLHREEYDLSKIAADCTDLIRPLAAERGITIATELTATPCRCDAGRIAQVVTNLLTNAIEHTRDRITVHSHMENGSAILAVSDTGSGIAPENMPHLFERFYRANFSRHDGALHSGLGLSISKAIVEAHGGALDASSPPGEGATFRIQLPVACSAKMIQTP